MVTAADEKMYLQDDPSEKCGLQEICGKGYPGKNSHGKIVCFTGGCKFDTRARGPVEQQAQPNPCIENGCTDIDQCDEICQHSRIYSPAWVKQHDAEVAARITAQLTAQHKQELRDAIEGERKRVLEELTDETKIRNLRIENGEFYLATEGVVGHQFIRLITDFYESNGNAPNYFTMEVSGNVREKFRRFELTLRELINGEKSPADTIFELKREIESLRSTGSNPGEQEQRAELPPSMPEGGTDVMK